MKNQAMIARKYAVATIAVAAILAAGWSAFAQDRSSTSEEPIAYEFEFSYSEKELRDPSARRDMNQRLTSDADAYCADMTAAQGQREYRGECRREVVRATRDDLDAAADQRARGDRYAARDE